MPGEFNHFSLTEASAEALFQQTVAYWHRWLARCTAEQFMAWLEARCHEINPDGSLQLMYDIHGNQLLTEETLDHLEGYCGSRPVRIGNAAAQQLQLDIYGELLDAIYLYARYDGPISYDLWTHLRRLINWVCQHWRQPDEGIWEIRNSGQGVESQTPVVHASL